MYGVAWMCEGGTGIHESSFAVKCAIRKASEHLDEEFDLLQFLRRKRVM